MATQSAKDVMTRNPECCRVSDTVYDAVQIMSQQDCGVVPVVDNNERCIGIVTDRDITLNVVLNNLDPKNTRLEEVMTRNPVTCTEDEPLSRILDKMEKNRIKRIVVVDSQDRCCGIISEHDIVTQDKDTEEVAEFVGAVYG